MVRSLPLRVLSPANVLFGELFRQPGLLGIVILGPFLILLAFVLGARVYRDFPRTIIVQPAGQVDQGPLEMGAQNLSNFLQVVDETTDRDAALARLRRGEVQLVLELPQDPAAALRAGRQAEIHLSTNEIDPLANSFFTLYVESQIAELNRQAIAQSVGEARTAGNQLQGEVDRLARTLDGLDSVSVAEQRRRLTETSTLLTQIDRSLAQLEDIARAAGAVLGTGPGSPLAEIRAQRERLSRLLADVRQLDTQLAQAPSPAETARLREQIGQAQALLTQLRDIDPNVLSAPFAATIDNIAPYQPPGTTYFLPGILALILQHLAVTLAAVGVARDRRLGIFDLYRLAPASAWEILSGKYLGLGLIVAAIGVLLTLGVLVALHVPVLGGVGWLALVLGVFLLAALALGFVLGLLTTSEAAAIQAAMLLLIASVAFGGLLAPLEQMMAPLQVVAYVLPVTSGRLLLEAAMFRGYIVGLLAPAVLGVLLLTLLVSSYRLFGRELARR